MKVLLFALLLLAPYFVDAQVCNGNYRVDCGFDDQNSCQSHGCCWDPVQDSNNLKGEAWCFRPWQQSPGYRLNNLNQTTFGYEADLVLVHGTSIYGQDISPLKLNVFYETADRLRVKIYDPNNERWEVPYVIEDHTVHGIKQNTNYDIKFTEYPFGFAVIRKSNGDVIFNSSVNANDPFNGLVFEDQYLEISSNLPANSNLYGLGEHIRPFRLDSRIYTLWNLDEGTPENKNIYGYHPFYMDMRNGNAHGVFLLSSNGMDVLLQDRQRITFKIIGGIFDLYFFMGPNPQQVTQQYQNLVGNPYMIPYWGLGFHQCRWGYRTLSEVEDVVAKYRSNNIPLETMWTDIDYMDQYRDFTTDPVRFPTDQMATFIDNLHANNQHYVLITDPGISVTDPSYEPFILGNQMDIWVKDKNNNPWRGKVWPGATYFPDFMNPKTMDYWQTVIQKFHDQIPFDGLWIDMNEISNFCEGECSEKIPKKDRSVGFDPVNPPYAINNADNESPLNYNTMDTTAIHYGGVLEYNAHNMYGFLEGFATSKALENVLNKRAFVISRSTFSSHGKHANHWTGDVTSAWADLKLTIPHLMSLNMFGVAFVGADICGFNGNTTEELCGRWIEVGAFYPFSRDHNAIGATSQELYVWPSVASIGRKVLGMRYSLLPYYYTLFYLANQNGGTVWRPLMFNFPNDVNTYDLDSQFMIGDALLMSPVLASGETSVEAYFPDGIWYDFWQQTPVPYSNSNYTLDAPFDHIPIHLLGGHIIPMQNPEYSVEETRNNPFNLIAAFNETNEAFGLLFWDDGESLNTTQNGDYFLASFTAGANSFVSDVMYDKYFVNANVLNVASVTVLGVTNVKSVSVNGNSAQFVFNKSNQQLIIQVNLPVTVSLNITWN